MEAVRRRLVLLAVTALLIGAHDADGAVWRQVTSTGGASTDQVDLVRTADGVLHVAWQRRSGPNSEDLHHTLIRANGQVGATTPIATGWANLENPALVRVPGGIRAVFGGIRTLVFDEPNQELNTALSTDGGVTWGLTIGSIVPDDAQAYGSPVSAAVLPSGTVLQAWAGTLGTWVHAGLDPATPNFDFQGPLGPYGYDAGLAADTAGRGVLAWYSSAASLRGVITQSVSPNGAPLGSTMRMPGTEVMEVGMLGRTPVVARVGGGFYVGYAVGYPALNAVRVWRVGGTSTTLLARTAGNATATVAAAPDGRLWAVWANTGAGSPRVFASRSNREGTIFGTAVDAGRPTGAMSVYRLDASATRGALDILGLASIGVEPTAATYHRRVLPGLTLRAGATRVRRGRTTAVTFTVLDAGAAVRGARVRVGPRSGTTNRRGRITLRLRGRGRSLAATASAPGYVGARLRLAVSAG
jgi:hypothetical protein